MAAQEVCRCPASEPALRAASLASPAARISQALVRDGPTPRISGREKNRRKVACRAAGHGSLPGSRSMHAAFADSGQSRGATPGCQFQDRKTPVQSSSQRSLRGRQRRSSAARAQILTMSQRPLLCWQKAAVALQMKGTPATLPIEAGPAPQQMPISRGSDSKRPAAQHPGHLQGGWWEFTTPFLTHLSTTETPYAQRWEHRGCLRE